MGNGITWRELSIGHQARQLMTRSRPAEKKARLSSKILVSSFFLITLSQHREDRLISGNFPKVDTSRLGGQMRVHLVVLRVIMRSEWGARTRCRGGRPLGGRHDTGRETGRESHVRARRDATEALVENARDLAILPVRSRGVDATLLLFLEIARALRCLHSHPTQPEPEQHTKVQDQGHDHIP